MSCGPGLTCGVCRGKWRVGGAGFGTGYCAGQAWAVGGMDAGGVGGTYGSWTGGGGVV